MVAGIKISNLHGASTKMSRIKSMIINCKTTNSIQPRMTGKREGKYAAASKKLVMRMRGEYAYLVEKVKVVSDDQLYEYMFSTFVISIN